MSIGSGVKNTLCINCNSINKKHVVVKCKKNIWTLAASGEVLYNGEIIKKTEIVDNQTFILSKTEKIAISIIEDTGLSDEKIVLDAVDELTIGRDNKSNIVFSNKRVSNNHAKIYKIGNEYHVSDIGSTNGTYVNNKLIRDVILKENDEIVIGRYTLIFTGEEILFKNVGRELLIHYIKKRERNLKEIPMFKRSPRLKLDTPTGDIEIQAAPSVGEKPEINWLTVLLPGLGMAGIMGLTIILAGGSPMSLMMTGPMALIGIVVSITTYRSQLKKFRAQNALRYEKYTEYTNNIVEDIKSYPISRNT